jgi:hypothetical protein
MRILPALLLAAATFVAVPAHAAGREEDPRARLPESIRRIETETGGRVLQVRPMQRGDREIYRMKVLTPEGRVRVMQDDPRRRARDQAPPPKRERDDD